MFHKLFNSFQQFHPLLRSARILNDEEKIECLKFFANENSNLHKIKSNEFLVKELDAKVGDILCLIRKDTYIYRLVVN